MSTILNAYKTVAMIDAYSLNGINDDPIFPYPPNDFDGDNGESKDIQIFIRNDGTTTISSLSAVPIDKGQNGREVWIRLALSQIDLDSATPGASLSLPDRLPGQTYSFFERLTVPAGTEIDATYDVVVRLQAFDF